MVVVGGQPYSWGKEAVSCSAADAMNLFPEASRKCMVGVGRVTCDFVCSGQAALLRNVLDVGK